MRARSGLFYAELPVFALHANTVSFTFLLPGAIAGNGWLTALGSRRDGARDRGAAPRPRYELAATLVRALPIAIAFPLLLALAVVGLGLVALFYG